MTPVVRELVLLDERDQALLMQAVDSALASWSARWCPARPQTPFPREAMVSQALTPLPDHAAWQLIADGTLPGIRVATTEDTRQRLALHLLGRQAFKLTPDQDDWLWPATDEALQDLYLHIRTALQALGANGGHHSDDQDGARELFKPYGGALAARIEDIGVSVLVSGPLLPRSPASTSPAKPSLASLSSTIQARSASLAVTLDGIDVALRDLLALRAGDVVRFPNPLDAPLPVSVLPAKDALLPQGTMSPPAVFLANLGHIGDRVALRLVSPAKDARITATSTKP